MRFPTTPHAEGWHVRMPLQHAYPTMTPADDVSPARPRWGIPALVGAVALGALVASAGLEAAEDPLPLDEQLSVAMHHAGETLQRWQGVLSRGLQVSLRAVADGRDAAAPAADTVVAVQTPPVGLATVDAAPREAVLTIQRDGDEPVRPDLSPVVR